MESAGSLKTLSLHGIHFVNQKRNVRATFHVNHFSWAEPHNHHSSRRVAAVVLILLDLGLEALESNNFTEKRSVGKFGSFSFEFPNSPRFVG